jgi:hypothetical protein
MAYSSARDWFAQRSLDWRKEEADPQHAEEDALPATLPTVPKSIKGMQEGEIPPKVVEEVLDWLKDEVDDTWLDDCVKEVAESPLETLELVDAGKKMHECHRCKWRLSFWYG